MTAKAAVLFFGAMLVKNFILTWGLGLVWVPSGRKKIQETLSLGLWVVAGMTAFGLLAFLVDTWILIPLKIDYLRIFIFMALLSALYSRVQEKVKLPANNGVVAFLAVALLSREFQYNLLETLLFAFGTGMGIALIWVILAGIRERLELADVPHGLEGVPILWLSLGIVSLAFLGFQGFFKI